ncbi:hypothetical protein EYF80_050969 [Liparis tanakae]|uniref:Uncharacterized protein n=1 Tax=Liparis tanakae TaxID=230148 RepID=A0A4Z2FDA8_9TELE|nr:hypothetical protein EYF80_050969 [Liparis tanakae]
MFKQTQRAETTVSSLWRSQAQSSHPVTRPRETHRADRIKSRGIELREYLSPTASPRNPLVSSSLTQSTTNPHEFSMSSPHGTLIPDP